MTYKIIKSTNHPVVTTYMEIIEKALSLTSDKVDVVDEKDVAATRKLKKNKKDVLVVDSPIVAFRYRLKGFKRFIVWYQGVLPEESYMNNRSFFRAFLLGKIEKFFLKKSKMLFLVSDAMLDHYERKYNLSLKEKSIIMPCFNETKVVEDAFDDKKYTENIFVYVGGLQSWQCFEQTTQLYAEIEKQAESNTKFYVYTFQKKAAEEIIKKYDIKNYTVDCVAKDVLSERIKKAKYGFVLRENNVVNNVATPTKFSNYLANGIIPIYSSALRSFADFDKKNDLGLVCDLDSQDEGVKKILLHMKLQNSAEQIRAKCEYAFSVYYNAKMYMEEISKKTKSIITEK